MSTALTVQTVVSMPFAQNSYIVHRQQSPWALVIDPGMEPEAILSYLDSKQLRACAILLTHGHADHIAGVPALLRHSPEANIYIGRHEAHMLTDPVANLSRAFDFDLVVPAADPSGLLDDGQRLTLDEIELEVRAIPGHSRGHVVFVIHDHTPPILFAGDVLFRGSIGRTDFPGGSFEQLRDGIYAKLWTLPDQTLVYPGHGHPTTIGEEKRSNPFVGGHG
jgi:glyoxylase-like metal-dependent hydrolase (beta-lactamase superfamily II)